jgi:hypothetical protein
MAKPATKQRARLERRQNRYTPPTGRPGDQHGSRTTPGSMNKHKSVGSGAGKRSRAKIQSDSMTATA